MHRIGYELISCHYETINPACSNRALSCLLRIWTKYRLYSWKLSFFLDCTP